ncbi:proteoglycan 4a [Channa argus]|uniref:proteoglycan 4a n=1 Tax=Channa argus TaxID=215402 RepID=UPI00352259B4
MKMKIRMIMSLWLLMLGLAMTSAAARPGNCVGRCGEVFTRGQQCTCDFSCLQHNECCPDFQKTCTIAQSCQGRCGETFRRGQLCECDPQCIRYNTCCHDYQLHCDASVSVPNPKTFQPLRATASGNRKSQRSSMRSNSESEEWFTGSGRCPQYPGGQCPGSLLSPLTASSSGPAPPAVSTTHLQHASVPSSNGQAQDSPALGSSLQSYNAPSLGSSSPVSPSGPGTAGVTAHMLLSPGGAPPYVSNQGLSSLTGSRPRPSTLQDVAQTLGLSVVDGGSAGLGAGLFADVDLCSNSPINGLTALKNGTILIFKGDLFWAVDPVSRSVGHPQSITDSLGISSPIDAVFTRCNCHGNTYIIKGDRYWRFNGNMVVEAGFPKPVATEFPGLTGAINAALAVPATRSSSESVYFFKKGDIMQRFTFSPGSTPSCSFNPRGTLKTHSSHHTDVVLSGEINIKLSLKGVPTPVTSALSMQSLQRPDRYHHYIFSGPLFFSVQIVEDWPVLVKPDPSSALVPLPILSPAAMATSSANMITQNANPSYPSNSIRLWLRCP